MRVGKSALLRIVLLTSVIARVQGQTPAAWTTGSYVYDGQRPSGATTPQQRAEQQGKPCTKCGENDTDASRATRKRWSKNTMKQGRLTKKNEISRCGPVGMYDVLGEGRRCDESLLARNEESTERADEAGFMTVTSEQLSICNKYGVRPFDASPHLKAGVAANVESAAVPLNGLRHPPVGDTSGWFLWPGEELSSAPGFFQPVHIRHLSEMRPEVLKYLALPPGWRFLIAGGYKDVWYDALLLNVRSNPWRPESERARSPRAKRKGIR